MKIKKKKVSISKLMIKADGYFSKWIRNRDAVLTTGTLESVKCVSCGKIVENNGRVINCGHYIPRYCKSTRYDEKNCNAQCVYCNKYLSGNMLCYEEGIISKYGEDILLKLKKDFRDYRMEGFKFTEEYLRNIIEVYHKKLKEFDQINLSINDLDLCNF